MQDGSLATLALQRDALSAAEEAAFSELVKGDRCEHLLFHCLQLPLYVAYLLSHLWLFTWLAAACVAMPSIHHHSR